MHLLIPAGIRSRQSRDFDIIQRRNRNRLIRWTSSTLRRCNRTYESRFWYFLVEAVMNLKWHITNVSMKWNLSLTLISNGGFIDGLYFKYSWILELQNRYKTYYRRYKKNEKVILLLNPRQYIRKSRFIPRIQIRRKKLNSTEEKENRTFIM